MPLDCIMYVLAVATLIWVLAALAYWSRPQRDFDWSMLRTSGLVLIACWALALLFFLASWSAGTMLDQPPP